MFSISRPSVQNCVVKFRPQELGKTFLSLSFAVWWKKEDFYFLSFKQPFFEMDGVDRERVRVDEEASGSERKASNTFKLLLVCGLVVVALILTGVVYSVMPSEEGAWEGAPRWTHQLAFRREEFEHCAIDDISDQPYVVVCWSVEGGDEIRFGIGGLMSDLSSGDNPDERFLGLGISANGGMYGADIVTYSRKLGLQDRFSSSFSRPDS